MCVYMRFLVYAGACGSLAESFTAHGKDDKRECVLFIGTRLSNLYTAELAVDSPAEAAWVCAWCVCERVMICVFGSSRAFQPQNIRLCSFQHFGFLTSPRPVKTSQ